MDHLTLALIVLAAAMVGGAVCFLVLGLHGILWRPVAGTLAAGSADGAGVRGVGAVLLRRLSTFNRGLISPAYDAYLRRQLVRAGKVGQLTAEDILSFQELAAVFGVLLGVVLCAELDAALGWGALGMVAGLYPLMWLNDQVKRRHLLIGRALPYALDLLTLSVEAGLDFTGALAKVVDKGKEGPLRDELQVTLKQLKMGKTREEALRGLAERVDLPPLTTFVTTLIQADRMGTSLGKVLRTQSSQMRTDRTQRAEKLAAEAPVKMLFPLVACIFPTVFMILFGPIVFAFMFNHAAG